VLVKKYRKNTACIFKILRLNCLTTGLHLFIHALPVSEAFFTVLFLILFDLVVSRNLPVPVTNFIMQEWLMPTAIPLFD